MNETIPQKVWNSSSHGDAAKAALLSALVIPGAGQIYNRQWGKGIFICVTFLLASLGVLIPMTVAVVSYYLALSQGSLEAAAVSFEPVKNVWIHLIVLTGLSIILYVYSIIDSYSQQKKMQRLEIQNGKGQ